MNSTPPDLPESSRLGRLWADLSTSGWSQVVLRVASHALLLVVAAAMLWLGRSDFSSWAGLAEAVMSRVRVDFSTLSLAAADVTPEPTTAALAAEPPLTEGITLTALSLERAVNLHTLIPTRGRSAVITYTVEAGDTLFGIADKFNLQPETILWGNYFVLKDDPHLLLPGQTLNILPVDGTYHYVTQGNSLDQIAKFYGVKPQAITDWGSNQLDSVKPVLVPNTWLVVPGGHRELQNWVVPTIKRDVKTAKASNFGQCPGGYSGAVGAGVFIWPTPNHTLSGYDYSDVHHGIDIRAGLGTPLYAVDSGVIVYAGPNDYGYGNLVVIDHGNGWQSVYGHLSQWNVVCGQSVSTGQVIGLAGATGNASGPHLHFELRYNGAYVNPWKVLPPP